MIGESPEVDFPRELPVSDLAFDEVNMIAEPAVQPKRQRRTVKGPSLDGSSGNGGGGVSGIGFGLSGRHFLFTLIAFATS